jgi:hypothetical protein
LRLSAACSYRTVAKDSYVDDSLFGSSSKHSSPSKQQGASSGAQVRRAACGQLLHRTVRSC